MKRLNVPMTQQETKHGWIYFVFQMTVLQVLLSMFDLAIGGKLSATELNILYFLINFGCNILIFHKFLKRSTRQVLEQPWHSVSSAAVGLGFYYIALLTLSRFFLWIYPDFTNINDGTILIMLRERPFLTRLGVVCLVPIAEELVYRGLIFRPLYNRNPWLGYIVSAVCFSLPHILGYIGRHDPVSLLLSFIQYIPAGLCLGWAYARSQTILAPVLMHMAINLISVLVMR